MDRGQIKEVWSEVLAIVKADAFKGEMLSLLLQSAKAVDMCKNRIGSGYRVQVEVVSRTFETLLTNNAEYWLSYALRQQFDEEIEVILVPLVQPSVTKKLRNEINDILCMLNFS